MGQANLRYIGRELTLEDARTLFLSARNAECLGALGTNPTPHAAFLRSRAHLRLGEPRRAVDALIGIEVADLDQTEQAEYHILCGATLSRSGDRAKSRSHFGTALRLTETVGGAAAAELHFYLGLAAWSDRDLDAATEHAGRAARQPTIVGDPYSRPHALTRSVALDLLGLVAASRENYVMQAALEREALRAYDGSPEKDFWFEAAFVRNLAPLVWDLGLEDEVNILWAHEHGAPWTPETAIHRWTVIRALGWNCALHGDKLGAFSRFLDCVEIAPTACARIESMLDRAYLAAEVGQTVIWKEEMFRASRLAKSVNWDSIVGEEAKALLSLAAAFSREDAPIARHWLSRFDRARAIPKRTLSLAADDRRQTAMELDAEGTVLRAEGREAEALAAWRSALSIWDALEHGWRAARTALEIAGTTKSQEDIAT
ncbi:MAG: hypothetical protein M3O36_13765, partial [Myxococcota bacterium]|nr:hypothetical protein [Myxococcota bacterium]